tara:strand:- start:961 stop:3066 length:2106 start_codon:yes stop_codon:yes gene_type:complete
MSRTEFEDIIKNLVPTSDLIASSDLQISSNRIAIKAAGVGISQLDTAASNSNLEDAGSGKIRVAQEMSGLTSVTATTFTGALTGNASTATALETARTISLGGDLSGSASFDGTANITLDATVDIDSVALGTDTTGNYVATGATSGSGISGSVSAEGGTFTVTSNATDANTASTLVFRDSSGNFSAGTITGDLTGNVTGDLTGNADTADTVTSATQAAITSAANLATVGTITAGTWQATQVGTSYGGTGLTSIGSAGQILQVNSGASALEWVDNTPTLAALTDTTISSPAVGAFLYYKDATDGWVDTDEIRIDVDTGNVGIGGAAATSTYELTVHGNQRILGDDDGTSTELYVGDATNIARISIDGDTGSDLLIRSDSGDSELFLVTETDSTTTDNCFNIRNNGTVTQFIVYDYDQSANPNNSNEDLAIEITNSTGFVGISGPPTTFPSASSDPDNSPSSVSAALSVHGHMYVGHSLAFGSASRIDRMSGMNSGTSVWRDIYKGISEFHTTLSTAISETDTAPITITVADSSSFGTSGSMLINSEQFTISGNNTSTNQITLSARAQAGTSEQAHSVGDIVSLVQSNMGLLFDGYNSGHTVVAIRANDTKDGFSVIVSEGTGDAEDEEVTFRQLLKATQNGVVLNEHGEADFDFRVEGDTADVLKIDASEDSILLPALTTSSDGSGLASGTLYKTSDGTLKVA